MVWHKKEEENAEIPPSRCKCVMRDWFDPAEDLIIINPSDIQAEEKNLCMQLITKDIFMTQSASEICFVMVKKALRPLAAIYASHFS